MAGFNETGRATLLAVRGVGPTVVRRRADMGFAPLEALARADAGEVVARAAVATGSTCWRNSPQAGAAVRAAIERAREVTGEV